MLQRDYIQRLIREFMAALQRLIEKDGIKERQEAVRQLFEKYLGGYEFFHVSSLDDVMRHVAELPEEERLGRIEMLAELYYAEADTLTEPLRSDILERAFAMFDFIDRHSGTFSFERARKMNRILKGK